MYHGQISKILRGHKAKYKEIAMGNYFFIVAYIEVFKETTYNNTVFSKGTSVVR